MEVLARLATGGAFGLLASTAGSNDGAVGAGIVIFAVGIVVGLSCVLAMDFITRKRMERDYKAWIAMGRPERRHGERRGKVKKIDRERDDRRASG